MKNMIEAIFQLNWKKLLKKFSIIMISAFSLILMLLIAFPSHEKENKFFTQTDTSENIHESTDTVPEENKNSFKDEKYQAILKLRKAYLDGKEANSENVLFKYNELEDACRQAFGATKPSQLVLLIQGIITANHIKNKNRTPNKLFRLYTPNAMKLESRNETDLQIFYEDLPEFHTIKKGEKNNFNNIEKAEIYKIRENYLKNKNYITRVKYHYDDLESAYEQGIGAYSPSFKALLIRGTLTAHGQADIINKQENYSLMTPANMGLEIGSIRNEYKLQVCDSIISPDGHATPHRN